jgi:hypothetical protein
VRLVLDAVDVAVWSQAIGTSPDVAALAASPLALEAGLRSGWRGLVVPLVVGGLSAAVSRAVGQPVSPAPFVWPLVALTLAALAIRYVRLRMDQRLRIADQEIQAAAGRAELAGQNSVAAGADSVVDLLSRTTPLLAAGGTPLPPSRLAAWKLALSEASAGQASYLGVVLARWERLRNSMSPDLRADVELRCAEGAGTVLLSPAQARDLDQIFDRLALAGVETVDVPRAAATGREQVLLVSGRRVVLPADPRPVGPSLDLGPVALLLGACSILTHSPLQSEAVPLQVTIPLAAAGCMLALWAHELVDRRGPAAHAAVLAAALALGGADAVLSTLTMHNQYTDHLARFPFLLFLIWFGPLYVVYAPDLSQSARWMAAGGAAAVVAAGFALMPAVPPVTHLAVAAVWPVCTFLVSMRLREVLEQDESDLAEDLGRQHAAAVDEAYERGRLLVVDLVAAAAGDARDVYGDVRSGLPRDVAEEFERRLAEVDVRLLALGEAAVEAESEAERPALPESAADGLRHVTVRGGGRRFHLVVPVTTRIGELLPAIARLCGVAGGGWALARSGEPALSSTSSLVDAGIAEDDVLFLVDAARHDPGGPGELAAVLGRAVDETGGRWTPQGWAWLLAGLAVLALLTAVVIAVWTDTVHDAIGPSALVLAFALLMASLGLGRRPDRSSLRAVTTALVAGSWTLAAAGGWAIAGAPRTLDGVAAAAGALAAAALATYPVTPAVAPGGALAAVALAGAIVAVDAGAAPVPLAAGLAAAGVLLLRALPRLVGLLLAALAADGAADVEAAARYCRELLVSLSAGTAAAVLGAVLVLLALGDAVALALAAVVTVSLLLQARSYRFAWEVLPPALVGSIAAVGLEAAIGVRSIAAGGDPLGPVVVLVATCLGLVGLAATWPELRSTPRLPAVAWLLVDVALAPLALAELGALGAVFQLVRGLTH